MKYETKKKTGDISELLFQAQSLIFDSKNIRINQIDLSLDFDPSISPQLKYTHTHAYTHVY